jgi:hypothetical protein
MLLTRTWQEAICSKDQGNLASSDDILIQFRGNCIRKAALTIKEKVAMAALRHEISQVRIHVIRCSRVQLS